MQEFVRFIEGWFTEAEGSRLSSLALEVPADEAIVEVGTYRGRSACWMAAMGPAAQIFCVDPWAADWADSLPIFMANVNQGGWFNRVTPLRGEAVEVARIWVKPVGLLFLDAVHEYEPTLRDFDAWSGFVQPGAYVAFHDDQPMWPGVQQVVTESIASGSWDDVDHVESLRILRRR